MSAKSVDKRRCTRQLARARAYERARLYARRHRRRRHRSRRWVAERL